MAEFVNGLDVVFRNLGRIEEQMVAGARVAGEKISADLQSHAKSHHPWTDRTSNTTNSTRARVVKADRSSVEIILSAGMEYDVFLELARGGKWAWLWPTLLDRKDSAILILRDGVKPRK